MPTWPARKSDRKQKVLVYLFGSLGDSIVAIPALRAVRRHFPEGEIVLLQDFASSGLVVASEVIPDSLIDRHISYESTARGFGKISKFYDLMHRIRAEKFDAVVYAVMSERPVRSVTRDKYFFRACGIKATYGFHAIPAEKLWPLDPDGHPGTTDHEAVFRSGRLSLDGIETLSEIDLQTPLLDLENEAHDRVDAWLRSKRRKANVPLYSLGPGCKSQANLWPFENFVLLGKRILSKYDCEIMVVGGPGEAELGEKLVKAWGAGINAAGSFSVKESGVLLSKSDFHIGLDTGTTHLAAAAGTCCFVIFGERSNPGLWYPLGNGHTVLYHRVPCAGCHTQICPVADHPCMTKIAVESVWQHLVQFLDRRGAVDHNGCRVIAV